MMNIRGRFWFVCVAAVVQLASCGGLVVSQQDQDASLSASDGADSGIKGGTDANGAPAKCKNYSCDGPGCGPCLVSKGRPVWQLAARNGLLYSVNWETGVYFADGEVARSDSSGTNHLLLADDEPAPVGITVSEAGVCWVNLGLTVDGDYNNDGAVRCYLTGNIYDLYGGEERPGSVRMDSAEVFYTTPTAIRASRLDGSESRIVTISNSQADPVMALDEKYVYWNRYKGIYKVIKTGGLPETVAQGDWEIGALLVDGDTVFFNDIVTDLVMSVSRWGGEIHTLVSGNKIGNQMATDDQYLYYLESGAVYRVGKMGGLPELVAHRADAYALAVDGDYVFWCDDQGQIMRVRKAEASVQ